MKHFIFLLGLLCVSNVTPAWITVAVAETEATMPLCGHENCKEYKYMEIEEPTDQKSKKFKFTNDPRIILCLNLSKNAGQPNSYVCEGSIQAPGKPSVPISERDATFLDVFTVDTSEKNILLEVQFFDNNFFDHS